MAFISWKPNNLQKGATGRSRHENTQGNKGSVGSEYHLAEQHAPGVLNVLLDL
jgi:hypothetical protein